MVVSHQNIRGYLWCESVVTDGWLAASERVQNADFWVVVEKFVVVPFSEDKFRPEEFEVLLSLDQLLVLDLALLLKGVNHFDVFGLARARFERLLELSVLFFECQ